MREREFVTRIAAVELRVVQEVGRMKKESFNRLGQRSKVSIDGEDKGAARKSGGVSNVPSSTH